MRRALLIAFLTACTQPAPAGATAATAPPPGPAPAAESAPGAAPAAQPEPGAAAAVKPAPGAAPAVKPAPGAAPAPKPAALAAPTASARAACVDAQLAARHLNQYGDPPGTVYAGGTPLFDERTSVARDRIQYVLDRHPGIGQACAAR